MDGEELTLRFHKMVACALLLRYFPEAAHNGHCHGGNEMSGVIGGVLGRCGADVGDAGFFLDVICKLKGFNRKDSQNFVGAARRACESVAKGDRAYGFPKLTELIGKEIAQKLRKLLRRVWGTPESAALDDAIEELNEHNAITVMGSSACIIHTSLTAGHERVEYWKLDTFHNMYAPLTVEITDEKGKSKRIPATKLWMAHPARQQSAVSIFFPAKSRKAFTIYGVASRSSPASTVVASCSRRTFARMCARAARRYTYACGAGSPTYFRILGANPAFA